MNEETSAPFQWSRGLFSLLFAAAALVVLGWMLFNVHPDTRNSGAGTTRLDLTAELGNFANNLASDALSELTYIPKHYSIAENALAGPRPDPDKFGSTTDPMEVMAVIDSAWALLDGQNMVFDPEADFQAGKEIRYYCDDTILVIAWREIVEGKCCTFAEIKVQDGSQLRRKLAGDVYGSGKRLYTTSMAADANAVVAVNGDFYTFRDLGITAYRRQVYRCVPNTVDVCFFTASGDMLLAYANDLQDAESAQRFMDENDALFALSFGPVLVDNGELNTVTQYPIGEIYKPYSRTAIGITDDLHYLLMAINFDLGYTQTATIHESARFMYERGCVKAYALDGGQTSVIAMQGETLNHVDFGAERAISDIIYFASALPEQEGTA